jgi:hypothetical protein
MTAIVGGLGAEAGARYRPLLFIVPQLAPEHPAPDSDQITAFEAPAGTIFIEN